MAGLSAELAAVSGLVFAYVHGSFLSSEFSDVDIGAYFDEPPDAKDLVRIEAGLERTLGLPLDLQALNKAPLAFAYRVISEGRPVFARDDIVRLDYEERVRDLYFDFRPFLERYYEEAVHGGR